MKVLYSTKVTNHNAANGIIEVSDGQGFIAAEKGKGTNPEQLIGAAWATCLHIVLKMVLKNANKEELKSRTSVNVDLVQDENSYHFEMVAAVAIEGMEIDEIQALAEKAHAICPVSKLVHQSPTIKVIAEKY